MYYYNCRGKNRKYFPKKKMTTLINNWVFEIFWNSGLSIVCWGRLGFVYWELQLHETFAFFSQGISCRLFFLKMHKKLFLFVLGIGLGLVFRLLDIWIHSRSVCFEIVTPNWIFNNSLTVTVLIYHFLMTIIIITTLIIRKWPLEYLAFQDMMRDRYWQILSV